MQYIAEDPVHVVIANEKAPIFDNKGNMVHDGTRRIYAKFRRGGVPQWAQEIAKQTFDFKKKPDEIPVERWISYYDTIEDAARMGWDEYEQELIDKKLAWVDGIVTIEKPAAQPPYPTYDKQRLVKGKRTLATAIADIIATVKTTGIDPKKVIDYEVENKNNKELIEALSAIEVEPVEEEELISA